jgi:hypothetical protein
MCLCRPTEEQTGGSVNPQGLYLTVLAEAMKRLNQYADERVPA